MDDSDLRLLKNKINQLLAQLEQLRAENRMLRMHETAWRKERAQLIEKNDIARQKVEAMISRLKALEQDT